MSKISINNCRNFDVLQYPFGMELEGRTYSSSGYRHGFNGQIKDNEIYVEGNTYSAQYWEYDSRLGRRWNLDPKPNASISEYACFANNPIMYNDPFGDTIKFTHNIRGLIANLMTNRAIKKDTEFAKIYKELDKSTDVFNVRIRLKDGRTLSNDDGSYTLSFGFSKRYMGAKVKTNMYEEFYHGFQLLNNEIDITDKNTYDAWDEYEAKQFALRTNPRLTYKRNILFNNSYYKSELSTQMGLIKKMDSQDALLYLTKGWTEQVYGKNSYGVVLNLPWLYAPPYHKLSIKKQNKLK